MKQQAGYTNKSGPLRDLVLTYLKLAERSPSCKPFYQNAVVKTFASALASDGNPLKPAIEVDRRYKVCVGLNREVDNQFLDDHSNIDAEFLNKNIITEVVVSSLTTLDNVTSLPVATHYFPKSGKTEADIRSFIYSLVKSLQTCENCIQHIRADDLVFNNENVNCNRICQKCLEFEKVCNDCTLRGQTSYIPNLRACDACLDANINCVQCVLLIVCADCEEGQKNAFKSIRSEIEASSIDPEYLLLTVLPDVPHVGKSLKCSYSNWYLKLGDERGNLSIIRNLRNRSAPDVQKKMRSFIPINDHVRNRDRQDPQAVLTLTHKPLCNYLSPLGRVSSTIIPETSKGTLDNLPGQYKCPIAVAIGNYGWIFVLFDFEPDYKRNKLLRARLHHPVDD